MAEGAEALQNPRSTVVQGLGQRHGEAEDGVESNFQSGSVLPQEKEVRRQPIFLCLPDLCIPRDWHRLHVEYLWQGVMNEHTFFILSFANVAEWGWGWEGGTDSENGSAGCVGIWEDSCFPGCQWW